jgi:hypothetical protein
VIATGSTSVAAPGEATLGVQMTHAGRRVTRRRSRLNVTVSLTLHRAGERAVSAAEAAQLLR